MTEEATSTATTTGEGAPDTGTTTATEAGTSTTTESGTATEPKTVEQLEAELEKWKTQSRKHEERAKANAVAATELEKVKRSAMTETEKAVAEAKDAGRAEARAEIGRELVAAKLEAVAAGRLDEDQLAAAVEHLDLASFLDADHKVDAKKVGEFIDRLAPKQEEGTQATRTRARDLGQGARGGSSTMPLNGDPILASVKSKLGIS